MELKLNIDPDHKEAQDFIKYMKSLDFVHIVEEPEAEYELTTEQIDELERRMEDYKRNPHSHKDWEAIKKEIISEFDL